jgi:LDH2 family malate/lactate/ureidoglycolate dehydrogenase
MSHVQAEVHGSSQNSSVVVKTADELRGFAQRVLMAAGADEQNATRVAEALVSSNLCGVDTHGVWHLPNYVEAIRQGEIKSASWPSIVRETGNAALISGNWTFGHVTAKFATEVAIENARQHDLALVSMVQLHHIGRLGEYVEMAAHEGMISMLWAGGFSEDVPAAVPFGGRERVLHTNPVAMAFPTDDRPPMMFDFATTTLSGSKVYQARDNRQQLPPGSIVDKDGKATTDPLAFFNGGAHLPFGAHKGYAFMLTAEYLGRIFTGSDAFAQPHMGGAIFGHSGATMIVFKADLFQTMKEYSRRAQEIGERIRAVPPAPPFTEVLMPGDMEARSRAVRQRDGIPIPRTVWEKLTALAASLGTT